MGVLLGGLESGARRPDTLVRRRAGFRVTVAWLLVGSLLASGVAPVFAQRSRAPGAESPVVRRVEPSIDWPKDFEIGLDAAKAFAYHFGLVSADSVLTRVTDIGYRVASQAASPDYVFTFHVLDVPDANALALPGGFIFITRGMLDLGISDAALAHLIGHELAHVSESHFNRADRVNGLLSLLQTAAMVAAIVAVPGSSASGYEYDEYTGRYRRTYSGREAVVQGASIFGGLFRELLVRGYSRGLEIEADETGRRFAGRAGYPMSGGIELMTSLDDRIYEDQKYGYWRTHPYFEERVRKARAAVNAGGSSPDSAAIARYRTRIQNRLSDIAQKMSDEPTSLFLYSVALRAGPGGSSSVEVAQRLLRRRAEWQRREKPVLRSYGPIIADYDSLLVLVEDTKGVSEPTRDRLREERDALDRERDAIYDELVSIVSSRNAGTQFLELFLENFPEDPRAPRIRFRLAELYRLSDRADEAALMLDRMLRDLREPSQRDSVPEDAPNPPPADTEERIEGDLASSHPSATEETVTLSREDWITKTEDALRTILPQTEDLTTNRTIFEETASDSVRAWSHHQLGNLAASLDSLEVGSRYLERYPSGDVSQVVRERMEDLAHERYLQARLNESLRRFQTALDEYNELILLAPETAAAAQARQGIGRIQTLASR